MDPTGKRIQDQLHESTLPTPEPTSSLLPAPCTPCASFKILYLFSGKRRKTDLKSVLWEEGLNHSLEMNVTEFDIINDPSQDLLDDGVWETIQQDIKNRVYDLIVVSPPCATYSRATYRPKDGPRPMRSQIFFHGASHG